ncbi:choline-sulfatase [Melghirimyces profundicolus]|uniref:Choline-sulfatase n=1 Tax=Melghirimyces profundicolus TaxID=1242148 RepID=A0A2T6B9F0_9BACL|nr:sulfatase-like hydrolase/transferase [Melghirimyces profundicolus]PTX52711.1 choline-sulfatase [Melghirimyces profundicolus]
MKQPNILWICTDQQRFDTLGVYGNQYVKTPNIDRLAENGVLFENAFCQSTVCAPSRASFLTGRYPRTTRCRKNGQNIPEEEVLVTRLLAEGGYTCGLSGKLHISACHPKVCSATERRINDGYSQFYWSHHPAGDWPTNEYIQWLRNKGKTFSPEPVEGCKYIEYGPDAEDHQATWCAEKAIEFIEANQNFEKPWLFSVNIFAPHHPFDPPKSHLQRYLDRFDEIPLPNYKEGELECKTSFQRRDHEGAYGNTNLYPFCNMTETDHRYVRAAYWAMIDLIDEQVGKMIEALERTDQLEDTIVIFMSDHGELLGDHGIYLKGPHFYEPCVHVPLIVSFPGTITKGSRSSALVELVDLAPTLLEAAGVPDYPGMQGKSIWPVLIGEAEQHRQDVYCESYDFPDKDGQVGYAGMIRTERYKLTMYHMQGDGELYDLEKDPNETQNLWDDPEYQSVRFQMLERLCKRMAETVDPLPSRISPW